MIHHPKGIGIYLRDLTKDFRDKWKPAKFAKYLKEHAIRHAYVLAFWDEGHTFRKYNHNFAAPYVQAMINEGIEVGIWGFPHPLHADRYVQAMAEVSQVLTKNGGKISCWLHDPELPWKPKGAPRAVDTGLRGQGEAIKGEGTNVNKAALSELALELCQKEAIERAILKIPGVGITSYGMAKWHPIPYNIFAGYGWSSPQLYSVNPINVDLGMQMWVDRGSQVLIPSVPVFGPNTESRLSKHLNAFIDQADNQPQGFVVWSFPQMSPMEARILRSFSDRKGWTV